MWDNSVGFPLHICLFSDCWGWREANATHTHTHAHTHTHILTLTKSPYFLSITFSHDFLAKFVSCCSILSLLCLYSFCLYLSFTPIILLCPSLRVFSLSHHSPQTNPTCLVHPFTHRHCTTSQQVASCNRGATGPYETGSVAGVTARYIAE